MEKARLRFVVELPEGSHDFADQIAAMTRLYGHDTHPTGAADLWCNRPETAKLIRRLWNDGWRPPVPCFCRSRFNHLEPTATPIKED